MYELNPNNFNDLDEKTMQEDELNNINPNEYKNKVNKEYNNSVLMVEKVVLRIF